MSKRNVKIFDRLFAHAKYSTDNQNSKYIDWVRGDVIDSDDIIFYTDSSLSLSSSHITNGKKYGWLIESPLVTRPNHDWIKSNYQLFETVFTNNKELLDISDKFKFAPTGGCWILPESQQIHNKTKNVSIILSSKNYLPGHKLRHDVVKNFPFIDIYGRQYNFIENKLDGLKDYRFSFAIENAKIDYYFTEKLIDCFITGTVPIYWGCPSIGDFFNEKGLIIFDDIDDNFNKKMLWLRTNGEEVYNEMKPYIEENFNKAKDYIMSEDYIWENYFIKI